MTTPLRIATWNLSQRSELAAERLGGVLGELGGADIVCLQEASLNGIVGFCREAGLTWWVSARTEFDALLRAHGRIGAGWRAPRAVAVAGRGKGLAEVRGFEDVPLPEKVMAGRLDVGGSAVTVVCYHAPNRVQHQARKDEQAMRLAQWLAGLDSAVILGGDFNAPFFDPPHFRGQLTQVGTGNLELMGAPSDDVLIGPEPVHPLRDALRTYLSDRPAELEAIRAERRNGPLAVSYRTGDKDHQRYRYDAIWLSPHFDVTNVAYHYDVARKAGTDHGLVIVDAVLRGAVADPSS